MGLDIQGIFAQFKGNDEQQRMKFIILGLIGILIISLFLNLKTHSAKEQALREKDILEKENFSLKKQVEESFKNNKRLEERVNSLNASLNKADSENEDLKRKFDLLSREKEELIKRVKTLSSLHRKEEVAPSSLSVAGDSYWAAVLKEKADLEYQVERLRTQLRTVQINNDELQREKGNLDLQINNLMRTKDDLQRQLAYNQKLMDGLAQELVREKNDKFQIQDNLKLIRNENNLLKRQLNSLNNRRMDLEHKLATIERERIELAGKVESAGSLLQNNLLQVENLKRRLEAGVGIEGPREEPVELAPIVVRPAAEEGVPARAADASLSGKVLAVNRDNNFVIVDLGENSGIKLGDTFQVYRAGSPIASIEVIQLRETISACDIKKETEPIKVNDAIR